jgi:uncharacterized membrane protein YhiD involved in acid resistance
VGAVGVAAGAGLHGVAAIAVGMGLVVLQVVGYLEQAFERKSRSSDDEK